jgi:hypothetical protein
VRFVSLQSGIVDGIDVMKPATCVTTTMVVAAVGLPTSDGDALEDFRADVGYWPSVADWRQRVGCRIHDGDVVGQVNSG